MKIGGFQRFSLIDYPGCTAAVIFTRGCNFRCPYCHNPELVLPECYGGECSLTEIMAFLARRRGRLDGVVVTGGEPTVHGDLAELLSSIRRLGYRIKLDTNGSDPRIIERLLSAGLVDYVAMDIKAPFEKYAVLAGVPVNTDRIAESIGLIRSSGKEYMFRTTYAEDLLDPLDVSRIREITATPGRFFVQPCRRAGGKPSLMPFPAPFDMS